MLKISKMVAVLLVLCMIIVSNVTAFAQYISAPQANPSETAKNLLSVSDAEIEEAREQGLEIVNKITNPEEIINRVKDGSFELQEGKLPISITTYKTINNAINDNELSENNGTTALSDLIVTKTRYYDGRYFDVYDRYQVDGPCKFEVTYEKEGTRDWNTSMGSKVEVGGKVYKLADVKAAVSSEVGYSFGIRETKTQKYSVEIPNNKYWVIKVWVSYLVYEYETTVGSITIATGQTWRPNGLVIEKAEYAK